MPTNIYLLSFDTEEPVSADDRHALKTWYGEITRTALRTDAPVAVDHLEPSEAHVAALLPPGD